MANPTPSPTDPDYRELIERLWQANGDLEEQAATAIEALQARVGELEAALTKADGLIAVYGNNPSAWERFDHDVSDAICAAVYAIRASLHPKEPGS
jgi:hypothetical protein